MTLRAARGPEGSLLAAEAADELAALDWYYGADLGIGITPLIASGPNRRAEFYNSSIDIPFLANWTSLDGSINGRVEEAQVYAAYTSLARRFQYMAGVQQQPYFFLTGSALTPVSPTQAVQEQAIGRYIQRSAFLAGLYPLNRFKRFEYGLSLNNIDRALMFVSYGEDYAYGYTTQVYLDSIVGIGSLNFVAPYAAFVHDNTINGYTGPIFGQRYRFGLEHAAGNLSWTNYSADYRRYDATLFSYLTLATRVQADISTGSGELEFPKYIGRADFLRGYDRENYYSSVCETVPGDRLLRRLTGE